MEHLKYDIAESTYDPETGKTYMKITSEWGAFDATTVCKEDAEDASAWTGFSFCEYKCVIKLWKAKARVYRERAKEDESLLKQLSEEDKQIVLQSLRENLIRANYCKERSQLLKDGYLAYTAKTLERKRDLREKVNGNK